MACNRKQQELSPSASPIKKKSKPPNTSDMMDKMANTVTHFEDMLRTELTAMRNEFASHMSVVQSLCSKLDLLTGEMREQKLSQITIRRVAALDQQVMNLQDRNKCSNLRLVGLPDGSERMTQWAFWKGRYRCDSRLWLAKRLKWSERIACTQGSPQIVLNHGFTSLNCCGTQLILRPARLHVPVKTSDGATLSFFPDLCCAFVPIRKEMREAGIQNYLLYPATLKVILNQGEPKMLHSPEEAGVFLRSHSSTTSQWTSAGRAV